MPYDDDITIREKRSKHAMKNYIIAQDIGYILKIKDTWRYKKKKKFGNYVTPKLNYISKYHIDQIMECTLQVYNDGLEYILDYYKKRDKKLKTRGFL